MRLVFPGIFLVAPLLFGIAPAYGYNPQGGLSCPRTEQQYQAFLFHQRGITEIQRQALIRQCYEEVKWRVQREFESRLSGMVKGHRPGQAPGPERHPEQQTCVGGLYGGQTVHPDKCLMGQGAEVMERMMRAFFE